MCWLLKGHHLIRPGRRVCRREGGPGHSEYADTVDCPFSPSGLSHGDDTPVPELDEPDFSTESTTRPRYNKQGDVECSEGIPGLSIDEVDVSSLVLAEDLAEV